MKHTRNFAWAVLFLVILPLAVYTVYSGLVVNEMELPGGFRLTFQERETGGTSAVSDQNLDDFSASELAERQAELERRLEALDRQSGQIQDPQPSNESQNNDQDRNQAIDISGYWYSQGGLSYQISQNGSFLTIQEFHPVYGITAIGQGQIQDQSISINYQTAAYTQGVANLTFLSDGSLSGTFTDTYSGYSVPASLYRQ